MAPGVLHPSEVANTIPFYHFIEGFRRAGIDNFLVLLLQSDNSSSEKVREFEVLLPES